MLAAPAHANADSVRFVGSYPAHWLDNARWHATATIAALPRDNYRCNNGPKHKANERAARNPSAGNYAGGHGRQGLDLNYRMDTLNLGPRELRSPEGQVSV